jgi:hypothetical protein
METAARIAVLPTTEEPPKYLEEMLKEFDENENLISLSKGTSLFQIQMLQLISP